MHKTILFFVFTCVKDGRPYINKLFGSMLNQTEYNFVHFIYDNGSTENIDDLVNEYKNKANFEVIYEVNPNNIGLNKATEYCIKQCNKPYFIWINCDDWIDKNFFKNARKYIEKNPNRGIYQDNMVMVIDNKLIKKIYPYSTKHYLKKQKQLNNYFNGCYCFNHFFVNFNKLNELNPNLVLFDDKSLFNDVQICTPFLYMNYDFGYISNSVSYFNFRNDSEWNVSVDSSKNYLLKEYLLYLFPNNKNDFFDKLENFKCIKNKFNSALANNDYKTALKTIKEWKQFKKANCIYEKRVWIGNHGDVLCKTYLWLKSLF